MASDSDIRQYVYGATVRRARPPSTADVAAALELGEEEVGQAFRRLSDRRLLVLAPDSGEIVMAPPFAAAPTPFLVTVGERSYFANCVWDSFGVAAALQSEANIEASCACCGEPMRLEVQQGEPARARAVAHFAVPAAQWWEDITFT